MESIDLKTQIEALVKLQEIDTEIHALMFEKELKPAKIKELEAVFEAKKQALSVLDKKGLDLQKQRKDFELELGSKEESAKKLQTQIFLLKTNKEYQAMLQQIQDIKADSSVAEDKILQTLEQIDKVSQEISAEKVRVKEYEGIFNQEKSKIEARIKEIDESMSRLNSRRKQASEIIKPKILAQYEKILASRDGLAIVSVENNSCKGCNMHVPPQVINLIRMYERIITCEVCNRILYIKE